MKIEKIKRDSEFQKIYNSGKKEFGYYTLVFYTKSDEEKIQLGTVASKKTGNAVCRNRLRRMIREYFRLNSSKFKDGANIVCVAKRKAGEEIKDLKFKDIEKDLNKVFFRAKLIK